MSISENYPTPQPLSEAVVHLERQLETPQVPGELSAWVEGATQSFAEIAPLLRVHFERTHTDEFNTMADQDAELAHRVSQLREHDAQLQSSFDTLRGAFAAVQAKCEQASPDRNRSLYNTAEKLAERGLTWVIDFRKQEAAVATWFVEAFQRDRGRAD